MVLEKLEKSLLNCPVIKKGDYFYFVNPLTDGVPLIETELLTSIIDFIVDNFEINVDKIIAIEAMGIPLATALSLRTGIPFVIIRKRSYGLKGEHVVSQETGYSKNKLYINGLDKGDNVLIIDDVISTGGTLVSLINVLKDMDVNIQNIIVPVEKDDGRNIVKEKTGHDVNTIAKVKMVDGKVTLV
ncbi:MAG: hypoxanthine/guanine phosphoribosyltransferase [Methanobacteriaceae archaeon]|nr:hypoxanthine/guanine phosphoribosyltransferase [Methanobacteriaceae archaeon]